MKKKITIIIVTYRTNERILLNCLNSINKNIKVLIVENSKKFKNQKFFLRKFKNLSITCSGSNLGYGMGNNYGLKKIKTNYALILNPDTQLKSNFFKNLDQILKKLPDFHLIGCSYNKRNRAIPAGYFNEQKNIDFEKKIKRKKIDTLTKVDWIRGFSIVVNMKKFRNKMIFDKNYFLYLEEIDLCKSIYRISGKIYFANNLIVQHLGFKSSVGDSKNDLVNAEKLRNWHYMWSSFYFYKKNYSYFFALRKMIGKFLRAAIKTCFFLLTFQSTKRDKYLFRFLGILNSFLGLRSYFRIKKFD